jgi:His-Xaa-Ser system protein HxsD
MADEIMVEFDVGIQSLDALTGAAYRLIGIGTCQIDKANGRFVCRLAPRSTLTKGKPLDLQTVRQRFLDLVADENLRERVATKTEPVRNLILSLAFGSLAAQPSDKS